MDECRLLVLLFLKFAKNFQVQEQELEKFMQSSTSLGHVVQNVHLKFFEIAPASQDFFKESKTRMHALDMFELG